MLVQQVGDVRTLIAFQHITKGKDKRTICRIIRKEGALGMPTVIGEGTARCSQTDVFRKETGRRLAMTRALESFPKEFRTLAWHVYWSRGLVHEDVEFIAAYLADASDLSYEEALAQANALDAAAAETLKESVLNA